MKPTRLARKRSHTVLYPRQLRFEPLEGRRLLATLYRINAGGPELVGSPVWQADTGAAPSSFSNAASGGNSAAFSTAAAIDMTDASLPAGTPMALFQSERFDKPTGENLLWDFPVSPGQYEVRLYFAEIYAPLFANGARVFDVAIEGVTALDNYDIFADVGGHKGVMKSFTVTSDANLDVDFLRGVQNPAVKGIEILTVGQAASPLNASAAALDFGAVTVGQTATRQLTITNGGNSGAADITVDPAAAAIAPSGPYSFSFAQAAPIVLAPGQSTVVTLTYNPTASGSHTAELTIPHNGSNGAVSVDLTGDAEAETPSGVLYRINAGGPSVAGSPAWAADTAAAPSTFSNVDEGGNSAAYSTGAAIDMSHASIPSGTPMSIFQSERFDKPTGAELLWDFPVTPGQYQVRLYFAEIYAPLFVAAARVFDVQIEGVTVLDNYDVFADVGGNKGVVKTFTVTSDGNLDVDFLRGVQNPAIKAIEILGSGAQSPGTLTASTTALNFGSVSSGQTKSLFLTLTNSNAAGGPSITIDPGAATITPGGQPFTVNWGQNAPIVLAPGLSKQITVTYAPTTATSHAATLSIPHSGTGSPLQISLSGMATGQTPISFSKSLLGG
ncbi:MAG TPA: malectin domain-containing carbohydrate-binding protein, partial [Lacipirellula sp.]